MVIERILSEKHRAKIWSTLLLIFAINWKKCPSFRQILRVNLCCIGSATFFIGTWIMFYCLVIAVFCGAVAGTATLLGIE